MELHRNKEQVTIESVGGLSDGEVSMYGVSVWSIYGAIRSICEAPEGLTPYRHRTYYTVRCWLPCFDAGLRGVLSALRVCLLDVSSMSKFILQADQATSWHCFLQNLVSLLQEIASFFLGILHKAWKEEPSDQLYVYRCLPYTEVAAPSFQDMGKAVSVLIAHDRGLQEAQEDLLISEEHSLIMTCCWVSLKEIGMFLGPLIEKLIATPTPIISDAAVEASMAAYHDIFMRCRHWVSLKA
ncbi:unnamed protein product [Ranitomeya imitator]|uniref:DUF2428 domain-containing protein n=1 Tax=Ranitomeya imitator TaxID=111125 RepID=A0ABN9KYE1_9NEOB|nr:unnamed protein product [Ranitomeya imitator]